MFVQCVSTGHANSQKLNRLHKMKKRRGEIHIGLFVFRIEHEQTVRCADNWKWRSGLCGWMGTDGWQHERGRWAQMGCRKEYYLGVRVGLFYIHFMLPLQYSVGLLFFFFFFFRRKSKLSLCHVGEKKCRAGSRCVYAHSEDVNDTLL